MIRSSVMKLFIGLALGLRNLKLGFMENVKCIYVQ